MQFSSTLMKNCYFKIWDNHGPYNIILLSRLLDSGLPPCFYRHQDSRTVCQISVPNVPPPPYVQEVQFSGGGGKKSSPYVYPPIFRGGRCRHVYPEGHRCIFFSNKQKKSGVSFRCCQVYLKVLKGAGYPSTFSGVSWPKLQPKCMKMAKFCHLTMIQNGIRGPEIFKAFKVL